MSYHARGRGRGPVTWSMVRFDMKLIYGALTDADGDSNPRSGLDRRQIARRPLKQAGEAYSGAQLFELQAQLLHSLRRLSRSQRLLLVVVKDLWRRSVDAREEKKVFQVWAN